MYSWEIDRYIRERNFELSKEEYIFVSDINRSPQISKIIYDIENNVVTVCTNDGYSWPIRMYW